MRQSNLRHLLNTKDLDNQLTRKTDFLERIIQGEPGSQHIEKELPDSMITRVYENFSFKLHIVNCYGSDLRFLRNTCKGTNKDDA